MPDSAARRMSGQAKSTRHISPPAVSGIGQRQPVVDRDEPSLASWPIPRVRRRRVRVRASWRRCLRPAAQQRRFHSLRAQRIDRKKRRRGWPAPAGGATVVRPPRQSMRAPRRLRHLLLALTRVGGPSDRTVGRRLTPGSSIWITTVFSLCRIHTTRAVVPRHARRRAPSMNTSRAAKRPNRSGSVPRRPCTKRERGRRFSLGRRAVGGS